MKPKVFKTGMLGWHVKYYRPNPFGYYSWKQTIVGPFPTWEHAYRFALLEPRPDK